MKEEVFVPEPSPTQEHVGIAQPHTQLVGGDDPRLLSISECIKRLRARAADSQYALDPITVSARVLRELLRGYDAGATG